MGFSVKPCIVWIHHEQPRKEDERKGGDERGHTQIWKSSERFAEEGELTYMMDWVARIVGSRCDTTV